MKRRGSRSKKRAREERREREKLEEYPQPLCPLSALVLSHQTVATLLLSPPTSTVLLSTAMALTPTPYVLKMSRLLLRPTLCRPSLFLSANDYQPGHRHGAPRSPRSRQPLRPAPALLGSRNLDGCPTAVPPAGSLIPLLVKMVAVYVRLIPPLPLTDTISIVVPSYPPRRPTMKFFALLAPTSTPYGLLLLSPPFRTSSCVDPPHGFTPLLLTALSDLLLKY
ncbi:hypothetical protein Tco_0199512 [Tanacetum coccineum]|uniref:Uncharacterized protein n=1 Tax=Tanacetum coccineum TaxID=301880 RepID=A0ABQ4X3B7_9ASTR